jgi:protoheme ferro-lyase
LFGNTEKRLLKEGKKLFGEAGGEEITMIPCLNTHPMWVDANQ